MQAADGEREYTRLLSTSSTSAEVADAIGDVAGYAVSGDSGPVTSGTSGNGDFTYAWHVNFTGYDGPLEAMVVDDSRLRRLDSGYSVSAWVARTLEGTSALGGTFTVSYDGAETPPLPHNVSALEMKRALENLETLSVVTVEKNTSGTYGNAYWDVTFDSEAGDLPLMETTAGRLLNGGVLNGGVMPSTWVEQIEQGSPAVLVYDGSADPETRVFTAAGLSEDALYAFKVQPINLVGRGSRARRRPSSRARGAAPGQTTAVGGALAVGMAGVIYEQQLLTTIACTTTTRRATRPR